MCLLVDQCFRDDRGRETEEDGEGAASVFVCIIGMLSRVPGMLEDGDGSRWF